MDTVVKIILILVGISCMWCGGEYILNHTGGMDLIGMSSVGGGTFIITATLKGWLV